VLNLLLLFQKKNTKNFGEVDITVIDTPGVGDFTKDSLKDNIREFITYNIMSTTLDGIMLCVEVGRFDIIFTVIIESLKEMMGVKVLEKVMLVVTKIDHLEDDDDDDSKKVFFEEWKKRNLSDIIKHGDFGYGIYGFSKKRPETYEKIISKIESIAHVNSMPLFRAFEPVAELADRFVSGGYEEVRKSSIVRVEYIVKNAPWWLKVLRAIPVVGTVTVIVEEIFEYFRKEN